MELEASTSLQGAPPAVEEAMTIDYDLDPAHHAQGGDDAEMGEHLPSSPTKDLTDLATLEADMVDDDALAQQSSAGDAEIAIDDDTLTFPASSSTLDDVRFSTVDMAPIPVLSSAPGGAPLALAEVDFAVAAGPTLAPEPAFSSSALAEPAAAPAEPAPPVDMTTSLGDGGAAVSALETLDEAEPAGGLTPPEPSTGAELAEELDLVPNGDEATTAEDSVETVIETAARDGEDVERRSQLEGDDITSAQVPLSAPEQDGAASASSSSQAKNVSSRPLVNKDPLLDVEVPVRPPADPSSSSSRGVPAVFLSIGAPHGWTTYSLFHPERRDTTDDDEEHEDEHVKEDDVELLLGDAAQHELYYKPLDALFGALRSQLDYLGHDGDELVLEFDEIGLSITEDNVYMHQVTLHDFDRIHTGCQIPGRLHANLATQPRFSSGFNALAQHIAGSQSASVGEDKGEQEDEGDEEQAGGEPLGGGEEGGEHDESGTLEGDEEELDEAVQEDEGEPRPSGVEEGSGPEGEAEQEQEEDGELVEGPADDHDGPDSELVDSHEPDADVGAEHDDVEPVQDDEHPAEDEFDLESALAELDGDDVVAVIEGAQEDLLLHGDDGEQDEAQDAPETAQDEPFANGDEPVEAPLGSAPSLGGALEPVSSHVGQDELAPVGATGEQGVDEPAADSNGALAEGEPVAAPSAAGELAEAAPVDGEAASGQQDALAEIKDAASESVEDEAAADAARDASTEPAPASAPSASAAVDEPEKPAGPADVVIDYDDAFDGSAEAAASVDEPDVSLESKRSRDDDEQEAEGEETAGDAKRPRLSDPVNAASS